MELRLDYPALMAPYDLPPGGMSATQGWLPRVIRDKRLAFLVVGAVNTMVGYTIFVGFLVLVGDRWGRPWSYLAAVLFTHVISVLIAFVLYRRVVFRVRGHVLGDFWRFETVYLTALSINMVLLPVLVELAHLPILFAQALITVVSALASWLGHKNYSFRRTPSSGGLPR
jgi:putative flippase GtrA